jgi:putative DNA methylase
MKSMIKKNISLKNGRDIYDRLLIERDFPIEKISELAQREGNKKKPIYEMHKWWARRLGANIRAILIASCLKSSNHVDTVWKKFYEPNITKNTTILDPFMGGGTTLIEASKLGAKTIGIDIDPVAWFITKKEIEYCNPNKILEEFKKIEEDISKDILHFYKTIDHSGNEVDVIYYFWVDVIKCPQCKETFEGHPHYMLFKSKKKV